MFESLRRQIMLKTGNFRFGMDAAVTDVYQMANLLRSFREDLDNLQAKVDGLVREIERGE